MADRSTIPTRITMVGALVALVFSLMTGFTASTAQAAQACTCDDRVLANRLALGEAAVVGTVDGVSSEVGGSTARVRLTASYNTSLASSQGEIDVFVPTRCGVPTEVGQSFAAFVAARGSGIVAAGSCSTLSAQTLAAAAVATPSSDNAVLLGWTNGGAPIGLDERGDVIAVGSDAGIRDAVVCPGAAVGVTLDRSGGLRQLRMADLAMGESLAPAGASLSGLVACHDSVGLTVTATTVDGRIVVVNAGSVGYRSAGSVWSGGASGDLVAHRTTQSSSSPVLVTDVRTATTSILSTNVVDGRIDLGPDGRSVLSARAVANGAIEVTLHTDLDAATQVHRSVTAILVSDAQGVDLETDVVWLSANRWAVRKVNGGRHQWSVHDRSGDQVGLLATNVAVGRSRPASERLALMAATGTEVIVIEPSLVTKRLAVSTPLSGVQALAASTSMTPARSTVTISRSATLSTNTSSAVVTTASTSTSTTSTPTSTTVPAIVTTAVPPVSTASAETVPVSVRASVTVPVSTFTSSGAVRSTVVTPDDLGSSPDDDSTGDSGAAVANDEVSDDQTAVTSGLIGVPITRPTVTTPEALADPGVENDAQSATVDGSAVATIVSTAPSVDVDEIALEGEGQPGTDDGLGSLGLVVLLGGFAAIIAAVVAIARWAQSDDPDDTDVEDLAEGYFLYEPTAAEADRTAAEIDLRETAETASSTEDRTITLDEDWSGRADGGGVPRKNTEPASVSTIAREAVSEQD